MKLIRGFLGQPSRQQQQQQQEEEEQEENSSKTCGFNKLLILMVSNVLFSNGNPELSADFFNCHIATNFVLHNEVYMMVMVFEKWQP